MSDDQVPVPELTERQWTALGEIRRLQNQGRTPGRGLPGLHLATIRPLEVLGLVELGEAGEPDRKGRQWTAVLTQAGRRALAQGDAEPADS